MANGNFSKTPANNLTLYCEWTSVANTVGNYSTVTVTAYLIHYELYAGSRTNNTITCGSDSQTYTSPSISYSSNSSLKTTLLGSKSFAVYHNDNGSKSVNLSASWVFNGTYSGTSVGTVTASTTAVLDDIPRAATATGGTDFVSNGNPTMSYTNPGGFTVDAYIEIPDVLALFRYNIGNSGSYEWELTSAEREQLVKAAPDSTTLSVRLGIRTTIGSTYKYSYVTKTMTVHSSVVPTIANIVWTKSSSEPSTWPMTQGVTKGTMSISGASGTLGSTIKSYSLTFAGYSSTSSTLSVPNIAASGTLSAVAKVTDSRNRTTTKTVDFTVSAYTKPKATISAYRSNASGVEDALGEYLCVKATPSFSAVGNNAITALTLGYKRHSNSSYTSVTLTSGTSKVIAASSDYTWDWRVTVTDRISSVVYNGSISTGEVVIDILANGKGIGLGKVAEGEGLDCAWAMKLQGSPVSDYVVEQGTSGIWIYRKWASGIAECWGVSDAITQTTSTDWNVMTSNTATPSISYPFTFKNSPVVSPSVHIHDGNFWLVTFNAGSTTKTPTYQIARGKSATTVTFKLGFHVFGQWK